MSDMLATLFSLRRHCDPPLRTGVYIATHAYSF
ncbi:hypothetical protein SAMN06265373_101444 [Shimia sagamensis]|uniref:Uncharacterized protein n=1 Tax=Shimia sagamensis TaxID=1566352 RepID=A0ABY1NCM0_9RHOB|nr:hypothetical protein SAMN06265373_101444 [Shimia sagamensis]